MGLVPRQRLKHRNSQWIAEHLGNLILARRGCLRKYDDGDGTKHFRSQSSRNLDLPVSDFGVKLNGIHCIPQCRPFAQLHYYTPIQPKTCHCFKYSTRYSDFSVRM